MALLFLSLSSTLSELIARSGPWAPSVSASWAPRGLPVIGEGTEHSARCPARRLQGLGLLVLCFHLVTSRAMALHLLFLTLISTDIRCISSGSGPHHIYHCCVILSFPLSQGHTRTLWEKSWTKTLIFVIIHCPHRPWPYDGGMPGDRPLSVSSLPTRLQSDGDATAQLMGTPHPASPTAGPFCRFRTREMFSLVPLHTCSDDKQAFWQQTNLSQLKIIQIAVPIGVDGAM